MKKWVAFVFVLMIVLSANRASAACQENCRIRLPVDAPCPTWSEPFRTCAAYGDDPVCQTRKLACEGQLTACVGQAMISYGAGSVCVGMVIANVKAGGGITAQTALVCAIAAERIEATIQHCK